MGYLQIFVLAAVLTAVVTLECDDGPCVCDPGETASCDNHHHGHEHGHHQSSCHCHHDHNVVGRQHHDCCDNTGLQCTHGHSPVCVLENHHHVCRCTAHG